jgi:uncharacterized protein (DUF697 family)
MTQAIQANDIIRNHVLLAMGASMVPLPGADVVALSGIQMDLVRSLCNNYNVEFSQTQVKAAIGVLIGTSMTKLAAQRLLKFVPGIGSLVGGLALAGFSGASTFALGEVFKAHFESGGTLLNFDLETFKKKYNDMFSKGQQIVPNWQDKAGANANSDVATPSFSTSNDLINRLKDLAQMRDSGVLTEEEFAKLKKKIVDGF